MMMMMMMMGRQKVKYLQAGTKSYRAGNDHATALKAAIIGTLEKQTLKIAVVVPHNSGPQSTKKLEENQWVDRTYMYI